MNKNLSQSLLALAFFRLNVLYSYPIIAKLIKLRDEHEKD